MNSISVVVVTPAFDRTLPTANQETLRKIGLVSPEISVSDASLAGMTSEVFLTTGDISRHGAETRIATPGG